MYSTVKVMTRPPRLKDPICGDYIYFGKSCLKNTETLQASARRTQRD
eukprot:CAMPEP_0115137620 /NCGR_PEP_ID=MMETSP0227-20121206/57173_1 /TAXON_ID=89957 /ORGANISM="Polarella glacialis, Strain CCMP 1383" /LENGTH=46 /DNA_ID= /DNA_START= /DNA_END= /DNA_ORIENTATION=